MFLVGYGEPVNGTGTPSMRLGVESPEFPRYAPYGIEISEMRDRSYSTTT